MDPRAPSSGLLPGHSFMLVLPELLSFFASGLHTDLDLGSSSSSPFSRNHQRPVIDCCQHNSLPEERGLQMLSPNTPLDYNTDDLFSEGEETPQTPVRRAPLLRKCPGAPRKPRPVRKAKKGASQKVLRVLQAEFEAAFPNDAAMIQRQRRRNRLLNAQELLEQAIRC